MWKNLIVAVLLLLVFWMAMNFAYETIQNSREFLYVIQADTEVDYLIGKLKEAEAIHTWYLLLPPDPETGSYEWHRMWIAVYEQTIDKLEQVR